MRHNSTRRIQHFVLKGLYFYIHSVMILFLKRGNCMFNTRINQPSRIKRLLLSSCIFCYLSIFSATNLFSLNQPVQYTQNKTTPKSSIWIHRTPHMLWQDTKIFYGKKSLLKLGLGLSVGAIMANSNIDENIANWYQDDIRSKTTNNLSKDFKPFGTMKTVALSYAILGSVAFVTQTTPLGQHIGTFMGKNLQALIISAPSLLLLQRLTGGDRPSHGSSHWQPFDYDHGVSGHAYLGAIPFLTAAKMSNHWFPKALFYGASTLTGLSRINDNQHYASQVLLGWWIAYLATDAVANPYKKHHFSVTPIALDHGGMAVSLSTNI